MAPIATGDDRIGVKSDILNARSPMNNVNIATVYVMQSSKDASFIARASAEFWSTWLQINKIIATSLKSKCRCYDMMTQHSTDGFAFT